MIIGLNAPLENIFGFKPEQLSSRESNTTFGKVVRKLHETNQKLKNKCVIMPSGLTGMVLVLQSTEKDLATLAQSVNAKYSYDPLTRIGYIEDYKI